MTIIDQNQVSKLIAVGFVALFLASCAGSPPEDLGVKAGKLAPCPSSPNCVSSYTDSEAHYMAPWTFDGSAAQAQKKLVDILKSSPNVTVVSNNTGYLRTEFKSSVMGFVDDVEFVIEGQQVNFRSASRLGYHDLGANKNRIDEIRQEFLPCCH